MSKRSRTRSAPARGTTGRISGQGRRRKERMTFHLPVDVIDRAKNAVYWTPGLTLADLATRALTRALDEIERKNGGPFQRRKAELKGGRPVK